MTWYPAYTTRQEIVDFVSAQRPGLTTGDILDVDVRFADTAIFSYLYNYGRIKVNYDGTTSGATPDKSDQLNLLWAASLAYACEFLSYRGIIHFNVGGIQEQRRGNLSTQFMRMQPMFFMGANPRNMDEVMPFRSFKQIAQHFCSTYVELYKNESGVKYGEPVTAWDATSRGWGWNANLTDYLNKYDAELTGTS